MESYIWHLGPRFCWPDFVMTAEKRRKKTEKEQANPSLPGKIGKLPPSKMKVFVVDLRSCVLSLQIPSYVKNRDDNSISAVWFLFASQ